jgi:hypothetical protein
MPETGERGRRPDGLRKAQSAPGGVLCSGGQLVPAAEGTAVVAAVPAEGAAAARAEAVAEAVGLDGIAEAGIVPSPVSAAVVVPVVAAAAAAAAAEGATPGQAFP